jgi:DNA-binding XRE family transcriptional regulator
MSKIGGWESTGFGPRLKALREAAGLSQLDLAVKAGCHKITLSKLEQGKQEPAWPLVLAICKALGVTCEAFCQPSGLPEISVEQIFVNEQTPADKPISRRGRPRKPTAADEPAPPPAAPGGSMEILQIPLEELKNRIRQEMNDEPAPPAAGPPARSPAQEKVKKPRKPTGG